MTGAFETITLTGDKDAAASVNALIRDRAGNILFASGTTVPANDGAGYAKGCLFIDTNVAGGTTGLYCNKGTTDACTFTAITQG